MLKRSKTIGALVSLAVLSMICSSASPQTLEDLLKESREREARLPRGPEITPPGLEREEEKPKIPAGILVPEEKTFLDRKVNPEEYIVGPGDEFTIYLWGLLDTGQLLRVNPEGKLLVPYVGPIDVSDKTLAQAKEQIAERVRGRYDKVDVSVELSNLRRFRVFVAGQVEKPGSYTAWAVDRVFDVIEEAGGIKRKVGEVEEIGSRRNIKVFRQNGDVLSADLTRFLNLGDLEANPYVNTGDVIYVPPKKDVVTILGAVNLEGVYEFKEGESLSDLINLAGGLQSGAQLSGAELVRFKEDGITRERLPIDLGEILHKTENPSSSDEGFLLRGDDQVFIRYIPGWHPKRVVWTYGELRYPGPYPIEEGKTRLSQLVEKAGGFTDDAFLTKAEITRWQAREAPDPEFDRLRKMAEVPGGIEEMEDIEYDYLKTKSRETRGVMALDFERLFAQGDPTQDILLKHGDIIDIPKKWETVNVSGQVKYPGLILFKPGERADFYIEQAGGYSWNADKGKTRVIKGKTGLWLKPDKVERLEPGDTIFVPEKRERDWWELVKDASAILGQIATFAIVAHNIAGL